MASLAFSRENNRKGEEEKEEEELGLLGPLVLILASLGYGNVVVVVVVARNTHNKRNV